MSEEGRLLEEQEPRASQVLMERVKQKRLTLAEAEKPLYRFVIEYMKNGKQVEWYIKAHGFYWEERHKIFYQLTPAGEKLVLGSFYCPPDLFISQSSIIIT